MSDHTIGLGAVESVQTDRMPAVVPASIQAHGALLTLDPSNLAIVHAGGNTARLLGTPAMALLGASAEDVFFRPDVRRLQDLLASGRSLVRPVWAFAIETNAHETTDVIAHVSGGLLILELERRYLPIIDDAMALVQSMVRQVQQRTPLQALYQAIATEVRDATGFDYVGVCRFERDGSVEVVADVVSTDGKSFQGFSFPPTHVPQRVRALHLANWIRNIPDGRYPPAMILPPLNPLNGRPLDLSRATLRSVSSEYRRFLAGIGMVASLSLSLVVRGQLWGLVICHHRTPRHLPYSLREILELFAAMTSSHLELKLIEADFEARLHNTRICDELMRRIRLEPDLARGLLQGTPDLLDLIPAAGAGIWVDGRFDPIGMTPTPAQVEEMVNWLNATAQDGIFHSSCLSAQYPPARDWADSAAGLLALSLSRTSHDYVFWFRPEINPTASRPSSPDSPAEAKSDGAYLAPQEGLAAWRNTMRLRSAAWLPGELEAAHRLRVSLLEVVLTRIDRTARERETARQQQEKMARELDLRLEQWRTTAEALKQETERRAAAEAELSLVLRRTVEDQENERLRIALELHDSLGQSLALLQLGLESIGRATVGDVDFHQRLAALNGLAAELGRDINRLAWEIRPTALGDLPIRTAIKNFLETWSDRSAISFDLHLTLQDRRLPPNVETTLYRVLQQALTNVVRHAEASRVGVILGATETVVTMIIDDDGRGFATGAAPPAGRLGLLGIQERLALVNGSLELESTPGVGTTLFIRIPL